jgi:hypothetical protein
VTGSDEGGGIAIGFEQALEIRHSTIARNDPGNISIFEDASLDSYSSVIGDPINGDNCEGPFGQAFVENIDEDGTCLTAQPPREIPVSNPLGTTAAPC